MRDEIALALSNHGHDEGRDELVLDLLESLMERACLEAEWQGYSRGMLEAIDVVAKGLDYDSPTLTKLRHDLEGQLAGD